MKRLTAIVAALGLGLALAGCGRDDDRKDAENAAMDGNSGNLVNAAADKLPAPAANAAVAPAPKTTPAAPPPAISDVEQMHDDADATGLTARLPAGDDGAGTPAAAPPAPATGN